MDQGGFGHVSMTEVAQQTAAVGEVALGASAFDSGMMAIGSVKDFDARR